MKKVVVLDQLLEFHWSICVMKYKMIHPIKLITRQVIEYLGMKDFNKLDMHSLHVHVCALIKCIY